MIDFFKYTKQFKTKADGKRRYIWCVIRKQYLVLTPEEMVRQAVVLYLLEETNISQNHIRVEMGLTVNTRLKRSDILVFDNDLKPIFLIECKAPTVKLSQDTLDQIGRYNITLKVPYLMITNGVQTHFVKMKEDGFDFLETLPQVFLKA